MDVVISEWRCLICQKQMVDDISESIPVSCNFPYAQLKAKSSLIHLSFKNEKGKPCVINMHLLKKHIPNNLRPQKYVVYGDVDFFQRKDRRVICIRFYGEKISLYGCRPSAGTMTFRGVPFKDTNRAILNHP